MRAHALVLSVAPLLVAALGSCARSAEERQLDAMRADIDHLQDERDRADQPALGADPPVASQGPIGAPPPPSGPMLESRDLSSTQLDEEAPPVDDYADPDDTAPRPRIRVLGSPRVAGREVEQVDDGTASTDGPLPPHTLDPAAKRAYDAAMSLVQSKHYDAALDALAAFLVKWPDHPYADHAMYWRGECYYARGDYAHAADQFEGVLARFPAGAKAPDALLKLGMAQQRIGNESRARECFDRLAREFPQADAARHIPPAATGGSAP